MRGRRGFPHPLCCLFCSLQRPKKLISFKSTPAQLSTGYRCVRCGVFSPASPVCHGAEWPEHQPVLQGPGPEGRTTAAPFPAQLCQAEACPQHDSSITAGNDYETTQTLNAIGMLLSSRSVCPARPLLCPWMDGWLALAQNWKARGDMRECSFDGCDHLRHPWLDERASRWLS